MDFFLNVEKQNPTLTALTKPFLHDSLGRLYKMLHNAVYTVNTDV